MADTHHLMIDYTAFEAAKKMLDGKFERIIGYYLEDTQNYINTIKDGLENRDAEMIMPAAHTIKSSSRQIGAFALGNYAAGIEENSRQYLMHKTEFETLVQKCQNLEQMFHATEMEIKNQIK